MNGKIISGPPTLLENYQRVKALLSQKKIPKQSYLGSHFDLNRAIRQASSEEINDLAKDLIRESDKEKWRLIFSEDNLRKIQLAITPAIDTKSSPPAIAGAGPLDQNGQLKLRAESFKTLPVEAAVEEAGKILSLALDRIAELKDKLNQLEKRVAQAEGAAKPVPRQVVLPRKVLRGKAIRLAAGISSLVIVALGGNWWVYGGVSGAIIGFPTFSLGLVLLTVSAILLIKGRKTHGRKSEIFQKTSR